MRYSLRMPNNTKPIEKKRFRSAARGTRPRAAAQTSRPAAPLGRAVTAIDHAPVVVDRSPIPTATGLAHRLGWLEREAALDGTPLTVAGGHLWEGETTRALWERSEGRDTRLIGLTWVETFQAVVALPDAGIAHPGQLAGRRLALPRDEAAPVDTRRAAARRGIYAAIALAGLFPDEIVQVDVDAELLEREPNLVVRLLAVLLRAGAWAQLNAAEATRLIAAETGTTSRYVKNAHGNGWPDQLQVDLSHRKLDALRAQHDFLLTHGYLATAVDLGTWIDPRPLGIARELLAAERTAWT